MFMLKKAFSILAAVLFLVLVTGISFYLIYSKEKVAISADTSSNLHELYEGAYYEKMPNKNVQCFLCPHNCILTPGQYGICKARKNIRGSLYSMVYGKLAAIHADPIEKKPFFHVLPGTKAFSIATTGCNLRCIFCQNWTISQVYPDQVPQRETTPEQVVKTAIESGSKSIAITYSEPNIAYEYALDIAKLAKTKGLKVVLVSGGYIEEEPLKELLKHIDAYKVDFKAFNDTFYRKLTGGRLKPVLETMKTIRESGVWLEILNLIIPGKNDSEEEIRALAKWVKKNLGDDVPVHFSKFTPQYKLRNVPPTPLKTVIRAREIAMEEGLKYVYTGNVAYPEGEATYCPKSGQKVIARRGYFVLFNKLKDGTCPDGERIPGVWE